MLRLFKELSRIMAHYSPVNSVCYNKHSQHLFVSSQFATNNFAEKV